MGPEAGRDAGRTTHRPRRRATMADIAADLGISRQLVSVALSGQPGASAATRERVQEAARRLGYSAHLGAQVLRQATSRLIGVVFTPAHATEPEIVEGVFPAAAERGFQVMLSPVTATRTGYQAVEELLGYRCAALVVIGSEHSPRELTDLAERAGVPLVAVGTGQDNCGYDVVRSAGDVGIARCVEHLTALGHRRIAYVHSPTMPPAASRLAGYLGAVSERGLGVDVVEVGAGYTEESGAEAARLLLGRPDLPTAVVMGNDQAALGLVLVLERAGVRIPQDVSVTGFDDSRFAHLSALDLTTVRQDPQTMGGTAVRAALHRVQRVEAQPREWFVETSLVVRGSTAAPRR